MHPEKAIAVLDQAAASVSSNREGHATLLEAVKVLREFIKTHLGDVKGDSGPHPE